MGFPGGSDGKESTCNAGDLGSIPGLGISPGEGNGNPLQYSCLGNPMDGGAWWATVHGAAESQTLQSIVTFTFFQAQFQQMNKRHKKTKEPLLPLLKSWEQKVGVRSKTRVLCMPPALNTTKRVCKPPKPPLWPAARCTSTLILYKEQAPKQAHP